MWPEPKEYPEKNRAKFRKNSETGNSSWVELVLNWMKTQFLGGKLKGTPKNSLFIIKYFQKLENICTFFKYSKKLMKKLKTQAKSWKNSSKNSKKLKNRQLQLSWIAGKASKKSLTNTIWITTFTDVQFLPPPSEINTKSVFDFNWRCGRRLGEQCLHIFG